MGFVLFYFIYLFLLTVLRVSLVQPKHRWVSDRINCPRDGECVILANVEGCCYPCSLRHCHLIALFVVEEKDGNKIPEKEMKWLMGWMNEWMNGWVGGQSISVYLRSVTCKNIWIFVCFFWVYKNEYLFFIHIFYSCIFFLIFFILTIIVGQLYCVVFSFIFGIYK